MSPNHSRNNPVASVEPAMLATLVPISSAPIICSRSSSRRLTNTASALACFSSRSMAAREDAVSAVSLPENRNEINRHSMTVKAIIRSMVVIERALGELLGKKRADLSGVDVAGNECLADGACQNESQPAAFDLLVLGDQIHKAVEVGNAAGHVRRARRQADVDKMAPRAIRVRRRNQPQAGRKRKRH